MQNDINNPKMENLLNLALDEDVMPDSKWDVIAKYNGSIEQLNSNSIKVTPLINGYAVITILRSLIEPLADLDEIEYLELPKRLFF